jgi:hypothetical protein
MNFNVSKNGAGTMMIWMRKYRNILRNGRARKINLFFFKPRKRLIPVITSRPINIIKLIPPFA